MRSEIYDKNYKAVFKDFSNITLPREIRADQYGVRFAVMVEDIPIKFEIIAEGRISLESPEYYEWSTVRIFFKFYGAVRGYSKKTHLLYGEHFLCGVIIGWSWVMFCNIFLNIANLYLLHRPTMREQ